MRINERTGLIYTALFLTVSVGVITQNFDTLMSKFSGESRVIAVDDIFTVHAGREQRLFVLNNDVDAQSVSADQIRLTGQPSCGKVTKLGGSFSYGNSATCSGYLAFSYCLKTEKGCQSASVALRVVEALDPGKTTASAPSTDLAGLEQQASINSRDLEITNVHLGRTALAETAPRPASGSKLAQVAVDVSMSLTQPLEAPRADIVSGVFTIDNMRTPLAAESQEHVEIASNSEVLTDATIADVVADSTDPTMPVDQDAASLPSKTLVGLPPRMSDIELGFSSPSVMSGIDRSPFGTPCRAEMSIATRDGGFVELNLNAPCHPNSRVEIRHAKMRVALRSDHIGNLNVELPAFESHARFSVLLTDGTALRSETLVPELESIDRVAVQWRGDFDIALHALEFGAEYGSRGHIWQGQPGSVDTALRSGRGFVTMLGDFDLADPVQIEVYSLPLTDKVKAGTVDLSVSALVSDESCGQSRVVKSFRSRGGRLVGASGIEFKMPACDSETQSIVLKNVVRDLIIAKR